MADREHQLEKTPGTTRLALLGFCMSMPYGVPSGTEWPQVAEHLLNANGSSQVELLNFSVTGYSLLKQPYVYEKKVAAFDPDVLLVMGNAEDYQELGDNLSDALREGRSFPYPEILHLIGIGDPKSYLARHYFFEPPYEIDLLLFKWSLAKLRNLAPHLPIVFVMTPIVYPVRSESDRAEDHRREAQEMEFARAAGFDVIDMSHTLDGYPADKITLYDDLTTYDNYSVFGHKLIAEDFSKKLADYLKNKH